MAYTEKFQDLADAAMSRVAAVAPDQVDALMREGAIALDIRDKEEHDADHIADSLHVSRGKLEMNVESVIPDLNTRILCYCNAYNRGALSADTLRTMGYVNASFLSLVDMGAILRTFNYSKSDFASMLATIVCVLLIGVETGILVGVSLSLLLFLWRTSQPHVAIVGLVPGTEHFRNVDRYEVITHPSILTLRIDESLYFANAGYLEDKIHEQVALRPEVKDVILMCSAVNMIDASALESLSAISHRLNSSGVNFHLSEVKGPVMDSLKRSDFFEHFKGKVFLSQFESIKALTPE